MSPQNISGSESPNIRSNAEAAVNLLGQYVDASADSANRARTILLVMITASVLITVSYWNTLPDAWLTERINKATTALWLFDPTTKEPLTVEKAKEQVEQARQKSPNAQTFPADDELKEAKKFINARYITDHALLVNYIESMRSLQLNQATTLHAPFFGITFDVNDLGIFGGMTFIFILLWFRYSLMRELDNLKQIFEETKRLGKDYYHHSYHLLTMRQLLTLPPPLHGPTTTPNTGWLRLWQLLSEALLYLPSICYALLVNHDWKTLPVAKTVSLANSIRLMWGNLIFLAIILILNINCLRRSHDVDMEWAKQASELRKWEGEHVAHVLGRPTDEHQESDELRATIGAKRIYLVVLQIFAVIFLASTTILLITYSNYTQGDVSRAPLSSNVALWAAVFTALVSAIATCSMIILAWRSDRRDAREKELKIAHLEQELAAAKEKPAKTALPGPKPKGDIKPAR